MESRAECEEAQRLLGHIRAAYPEVLTAIKTKQLAQEMLLYKDAHISDVARTGARGLCSLQKTVAPGAASALEHCPAPRQLVQCIWHTF